MSAKVYMLFSSSKGNCAYIKNGDDEFLIDAGVSARSVCRALELLGTSMRNIKGIFVTHEHSDHIKGLPVLAKQFGTTVYAPKRCCEYLVSVQPCLERYLDYSVPNNVIKIGSTQLCPVATPHDARESVGYRIKAGDEKIAYFTDIGHLSEDVLRGLSGCERVIIESNHDVNMLKTGSYPFVLKKRISGSYGHLSNDECAALLPHLARHGARSFMLAHLSEENNRPFIAFRESATALTAAGFSLISEEEVPPASGKEFVRLRVAPVCGIAEVVAAKKDEQPVIK